MVHCELNIARNTTAEGKFMYCVGVGVLTAVVIKISAFWDVKLFSQLKVNELFRGTCRLHLQIRGTNQARNNYSFGLKIKSFHFK
jgi:hypothetical protein